MKMLLNEGLLHGDALTISGETVAEVLADIPDQPAADQDVIRPFSQPIVSARPSRHSQRAILPSKAAVSKLTGIKKTVLSLALLASSSLKKTA